MSPLERALRLHEDNYKALREAFDIAGGDLDLMLNQPLSDVLRSLAQNDIRIQLENKASVAE